MKKKILAMILVLACAVALCVPAGLSPAPAVVQAATQKAKKAPSISKVYHAVKNAYGENYAPNVRLKKQDIKDLYGISDDWYTAAIAEVPMISTNVDTLILVKTKDAASKKKVKAALKAYRQKLVQDTHQYPMNQLKIQASKVYAKGDYVCFFMLGSLSNKQEEQSEEKVIAAYKKQNEKAVKAIQKLYA